MDATNWPDEIRRLAPREKTLAAPAEWAWSYKFALGTANIIEPEFRPAIKIPDATPQIFARYALATAGCPCGVRYIA